MSEINPIHLPSVSDVVYDILRKRIMRGRISPNEQLNLNQLETELDVSRTPLKVALSRLQNEGLVEIHPRKGTFVAEFTAQDIKECFELRIALEVEALRNVFHPDNSDTLSDLMTLLSKMDEYFQDESTWLEQLLEFMDLDRQLHIAFVNLCNNSRMIQAHEHANVQGYIALMGTRFYYGDVQQTQAEHRKILSRLKTTDLPALLDANREHLENARDRALMRLTQKEANS